MKKFSISKGKVEVPVRTLIYGVEAIGKSTLSSKFPLPVTIDIEGGTNQMDIDRLPVPETWDDLMDEIDYTIEELSGTYKTLIIDTIDRAEQLLIEQLLRESGVDSIEKYGGGFGKGYTAIQERVQKDLLKKLDRAIAAGINVVMIGHAAMRKVETPEATAYDRWELKVSKKVAPIVKEWCDIMLFCDYQLVVVDGKAKGSGKRMMHANHTLTYDAKNRYGLPDDMPLSFDAIKHIFEGKVKRTPQKDAIDINRPNEGIVEEPLEDPVEILIRELGKNNISADVFNDWALLSKRNTLDSMSNTEASNYVEHLDKLIEILKK